MRYFTLSLLLVLIKLYLLVPEDDYLYDNMDDIDNYEIIYEGTSLNEYSFINTNSNDKVKYRIYKRIS